jgi:hypothetical protein
MRPVDQARNALAFLEDETHEHAFDTLIWGLRERRDAAAREVPEWEALRTLASQIKGTHAIKPRALSRTLRGARQAQWGTGSLGARRTRA